jgi:hypothetical protein
MNVILGKFAEEGFKKTAARELFFVIALASNLKNMKSNLRY